MKTKVTFTIDEELLSQVDDYCDVNYLNRSSFICQTVKKEISTYKLIDTLSSVALSMRTIAENGKIDDKTLQQLQEFEVLSRSLLSYKQSFWSSWVLPREGAQGVKKTCKGVRTSACLQSLVNFIDLLLWRL